MSRLSRGATSAGRSEKGEAGGTGSSSRTALRPPAWSDVEEGAIATKWLGSRNLMNQYAEE
ncbi:hypothetical protein CCE01nite_37610 [Cellulomonas cellasea]|uniref:Uncharacterized protein n=1 Tax=Cellulomonas cellasea TaxID=43670 RepID=A0A4Y3L0G2_9CELL|nr:hypothetical protein CCE01nite_37610 [Cellulomonas cellasea]